MLWKHFHMLKWISVSGNSISQVIISITVLSQISLFAFNFYLLHGKCVSLLFKVEIILFYYCSVNRTSQIWQAYSFIFFHLHLHLPPNIEFFSFLPTKAVQVFSYICFCGNVLIAFSFSYTPTFRLYYCSFKLLWLQMKYLDSPPSHTITSVCFAYSVLITGFSISVAD